MPPPPLRRFLNRLPPALRRQKLLSALLATRFVTPLQALEFNGGARAWVDLRDAESRANYLSQAFWPEFPPMVAAFLREGRGGDLFDVGANFGLVTFGTLPLVQGAGIGFHLFEANPGILPALERSVREWPGERLFLRHGCVTDRPGFSHHSLPDDSWGHGLIREEGGEEGVTVPNLLLDDYIEERGVESIAFLKMDIEGWELHALRGARRSLEAGKVQAGFIELAPEVLRRAGTGPEELLGFLGEMGFDLYFAGPVDHPQTPPLAALPWRTAAVAGTPLRFAPANPLPAGFVQGDVLILHRATALAARVRAAS
jgi:FkbM family methyltransferase